MPLDEKQKKRKRKLVINAYWFVSSPYLPVRIPWRHFSAELPLIEEMVLQYFVNLL